MSKLKSWFSSGEPYIWLNAGAVTVSLIMVSGLLILIAVRGLSHFWPATIVAFDYHDTAGDTQHLVGEIVDRESVTAERVDGNSGVDIEGTVERYLLKTGNRDFVGLDFRWVNRFAMDNQTIPPDIMIIERREWGNFYGYLKSLKLDGKTLSDKPGLWQKLQEEIDHSNTTFDEIRHIEKDLIGGINYKIERLRLEKRSLELEGRNTPENLAELDSSRETLQQEYESYTDQLAALYKELNKNSMTAVMANGQSAEIPLSKVVRAYKPNAMSLLDKAGFYFVKLWEFVSEEPREANTEGGIFPAIFGTVMMVMIMSVIVTPFGVIAAIYLREYAKQGLLTRIIRISVNNLAGVPSIVYGVFGLGFFVYFLGGSIDKLFFPEALPTPTFGTPGLLWASLTLAILTVPVVIVATEEGLSRVPREIREGSLALGATKAETLWRTVMP
ncbi:MAG TPA: ABC transporter permease subunit, partial [Gammaproteobacteria bacterium]|nr:ABC transporter permease subunit [Gammaproteobacteria bacterium]